MLPNSTASTGAALGLGLVLPPAGARPLGMAFARYLSHTQQALAGLAQRLPAPLAEPFRAVHAAAQRVYARNPRALLGCLASPTVGSAVQAAALRDDLPEFAARIDAAVAAAPPHLLLELALRRLLADGETIDWPAQVPRLASLALGAAIFPSPAVVTLRFSAGRLTALGAYDVVLDGLDLEPKALAERAGAAAPGALRVELPYHRVGRVTRFATIDHNPIAQFEAHPDKAGNAIDLGGHPVEEWVATLDQALALVEAHLPDLFGEMGMMLHEVVPVGYHPERHLSASYREAIGTVYMTLHPSLMTMTEAVIHEFQHNKLNAASYGIEFLHNPFHPRYPSPVRPDPRPLWGILLAVHAFLPVAVLYRRMRAADHPLSRTPDFSRRLSDVDLKNHEGMEMLRAHARWTPAGRALMDDLEALDRAHMAERAAEGQSLEPTEVHLG